MKKIALKQMCGYAQFAGDFYHLYIAYLMSIILDAKIWKMRNRRQMFFLPCNALILNETTKQMLGNPLRKSTLIWTVLAKRLRGGRWRQNASESMAPAAADTPRDRAGGCGIEQPI